jgi:hypothetical protein
VRADDAGNLGLAFLLEAALHVVGQGSSTNQTSWLD